MAIFTRQQRSWGESLKNATKTARQASAETYAIMRNKNKANRSHV